MISMRSIYALKALSVLARERQKENFLISELAQAENIPKKFLEAILLSLKVKGILASKKGPKGGYSLAKSPDNLTIGSIIEALEGDLSPIQCLNGAAHAGCPECLDEDSCGVRLVMGEVKQAVGSVLDTVTLSDMLRRSASVREQQLNVIDYAI
jgi:Rrf2 family protein